MLGPITLDDKDGNAVTLHNDTSGTRQIESVTGLTGVGSLRDSRRVLPQGHGALDETRWEDGRIVNLSGAVWSPSGQAAAWAEWDAVSAPMLQTLDYAPALLKWTRADGVTLQRYVKLADAVDPPISEGTAALQYQAQFFAEDPRAYSQTLTTATGGTITGGSGAVFPEPFPITFGAVVSGEAVVNNAGTRPTPCVLRVYGYATTAQVLLVGTTGKITLTGAIAPGDYLEIDTQARTLRLNGTSPAQYYLDSANTQWFELPKAASTIRLLAGSNDTVARCDVLYRSAY